MADLTLTAANVLAGSNATTRLGTAGDYPVVLGMAKSTSVLKVHIVEAGVAI